MHKHPKFKKALFAVALGLCSMSVVAATENTAATATIVLPQPTALIATGNLAEAKTTSAAPTPTPTPTPAPAQVTNTPAPAANTTTQVQSNAIPTAAQIQTATAAPTPAAMPMPTPVPKPGGGRAAASTGPTIVPVPPEVQAKAYVLIDADSGYVVAQKNADSKMAPASLTKLMTMFVISGALENNRIHLTDPVLISENAWRTGGSRMFVQVGTQVPVQDLINGIVVVSGNDACVAMAEHVAGSESSFVDLMNKTAAVLGMQNTHYADATGLPDPQNYTTPIDLSKLTRAIIYTYPQDYQWYSQKWMTYNNIRQPNRNLLLWRDPTVDGLKTGHTDDAGYCLVASAKRQNMRLIAVIMGDTSAHQRATDALALLNYGYRFYETHQLYAKNTKVTAMRVWFGKYKETPLGVAQNFYVTIPVGQYNQLKGGIEVNPEVNAPIVKGQSYGNLEIRLNDQLIATQPMIALENNPMANVFSRLWDHVLIKVNNWFHRS
ncbi:MAG TPA: D-alanyl-D-alanine carboxypeptidase family protein [Gammaproteobacteria bacterium]|nr:D-alanyl-D-alanine carboxypeptidase family protein [Gammaproteobacteria bacterium]